ncbi:MAG: helix-turn-helix domain-containing protein [Chitinispirillales bacterium]|nr:helix-turn-helix domain-containing protein [Chitinispirillales bacterium]
MTVGERVLYLAKREGFTQTTLAERLGINQSSVSLWGKGNDPRMDKIPQLAKLLRVSEQYLLCGGGDGIEEMDTDTMVTRKVTVHEALDVVYKEKGTAEAELSEIKAEVARLSAELTESRSLINKLIERNEELSSKYIALLEAERSPAPSPSAFCSGSAG